MVGTSHSPSAPASANVVPLRAPAALPLRAPAAMRPSQGGRSVAVIGAGITGVSTAHALMERGFAVTLIDRQRTPAMETSFANGGQLSASNAEVWTHPGTILKGMRWLLRRDAPLLVRAHPTWHKLSWMAEFVANCPNYEANTIQTAKLAIASRAHMERIAAQENIDYDRVERGILHVYRNKAGFDHATRVNAMYAKAGLERSAVSNAEMVEIEPALAASGAFHGGYYTPSDATGDIHKFTRGLANSCIARGMRFLGCASVSRMRRTDGGVNVSWTARGETHAERFDATVVCAGIGSRALARQLGDRINIYPVKGYSVTVPLDGASQDAAPWVSLLDDDAKIVASRLGADRYRVAGTAEFTGFNRDIVAARVAPLTRWVEDLFPGVDTSGSTPWAGLRPMAPSMMPRVGAGRAPGVFYNTGHGHLGWTLGAITAEMVADEVALAHGGAVPSETWMEAAE